MKTTMIVIGAGILALVLFSQISIPVPPHNTGMCATNFVQTQPMQLNPVVVLIAGLLGVITIAGVMYYRNDITPVEPEPPNLRKGFTMHDTKSVGKLKERIENSKASIAQLRDQIWIMESELKELEKNG